MKLTSKVLRRFQGVAYGHMTLEAMQNWKLSKIDLLVREVIQNCSDAADPIENQQYFTVAFNTDEFNGKRFIETLDGLNEKTRERFSSERCRYLEIRDGGTIGLTGPLTISSENEKDHGNYFRLVFDTGKAQTQKNSGGNWGYGKSAYYEIGAGFVIYYSQIKNGDNYESRLIVTLIEDEESETAILKGYEGNVISAGKAWWGKRLDGDGFDANILPLQDEDEIKEFLSIFNIAPFPEGETGTSVIIPYVDYYELMESMISDEMNVPSDLKNRCSWTYQDIDGFKEYLKLSIQRWYAPAINNTDLYALTQKKWLYATVNGELVSYDSMYPFFQLTQRLYTAALARTLETKETKKYWNAFYDNTISPISIKNYIDNSGDGNTVVGYLATARLPKSKIDIGQGENFDPFLLLGYYEESGSNRPIVMFARRLGMVIDYAYKDQWVHGVTASEDEDEYVFSFFVPCLGEGKKLKSNLSVKKYAGKTLEEYLISCEASDHEGWVDHDRMTIVSRIQRGVTSCIKTLIKGDVVSPTGTNADRLGNALSRMIGISKGKLGKSSPSGGGDGAGGSSTSKKIKFSSEIEEFAGWNQTLKYTLSCKKGLKRVVVNPVLFSDGSNLKCLEWEKDIRSAFPVEFTGVTYRLVCADGGETGISLSLDEPVVIMEGIRVEMSVETKKTPTGEVLTSSGITQISFEFDEPLNETITLEGKIFVHTSNNEYEYDLVAYEETR